MHKYHTWSSCRRRARPGTWQGPPLARLASARASRAAPGCRTAAPGALCRREAESCALTLTRGRATRHPSPCGRPSRPGPRQMQGAHASLAGPAGAARPEAPRGGEPVNGRWESGLQEQSALLHGPLPAGQVHWDAISVLLRVEGKV